MLSLANACSNTLHNGCLLKQHKKVLVSSPDSHHKGWESGDVDETRTVLL